MEWHSIAWMESIVRGLHHITLVTSSEYVNRRFYTEVLGLRRVKLTVNQDDIFHRHLFYGDYQGSPGGVITFFEWPKLPKGVRGLGSPHHLAYHVGRLDALAMWGRWLERNGVPYSGPYLRLGRASIYLHDPDGVLLEIVSTDTKGVDEGYLRELFMNCPDVSSIRDEMRLSFFSHASPITYDHEMVVLFLEKFLGLRKSYVVKNPDDGEGFVVGIGAGESGDFLTYLMNPRAEAGTIGIGSIHHIALPVESEEEQREIMRRLNKAGIPNSGIVDRFWFKSLYFRDPAGNLLEIATRGPGYTRDESLEELGTRLILPPWLERYRSEIEERLRIQDEVTRREWPPSYTKPPINPEKL